MPDDSCQLIVNVEGTKTAFEVVVGEKAVVKVYKCCKTFATPQKPIEITTTRETTCRTTTCKKPESF